MFNKLMTLVLGKSLALRLGFYNPPHISPNNLIVHSYIESVDGKRSANKTAAKEVDIENCQRD